MRRLVAIALGCLLLASCGGGSDFSQAFPGSTAPPAGSDEPDDTPASTRPSRTTTTTDESTFTREDYIEAARKGLLDDPETPVSITSDQTDCLAEAIIDGPGVDVLQEEGVVPSDFSEPPYGYPDDFGESLSASDRTRIGRALQACDLGSLFGAAFAEEAVGSEESGLDVETASCIGNAFGSDERSDLVATLLLDDTPTLPAAREFAEILVACMDFAELLVQDAPFEATAAEVACIDAETRNSARLREVLARAIAEVESEDGNEDQFFVGVFLKCLTPEHLAKLGEEDSGDGA